MSSYVTDPNTDEDELSIVDFNLGDDPPLDDEENVGAIKESNPYIKIILQSSGLHLLEEAKAIKAYETQNVIGLFFMFIANSKTSQGSIFSIEKTRLICNNNYIS